MKIDMNQKIRNKKTEPVKIPGSDDDMTLAFVVSESVLSVNVQGEMRGTKSKKFQLGMRVLNGGEVDLSAEEITLAKDSVGVAYSPLILGQVEALLEGKENPMINGQEEKKDAERKE